MSYFKGIYVILLLFLIGCGQGGSDDKKTTPPIVDIEEDLGANIVIDPISYTQPNFPLISSTTGTTSIFLNVRNIGTAKIEPVNISLSGMDSNFFTFTGTNCASLYGNAANVCTVGVHFNSAGKMERIYTAELNVNGVKIPFSANYSSTMWNDYQLYGNAQVLGDSINLGKTETQILSQKIILKHLRNGATGNIPLTVSNSNFSLNRTSCPSSEINSNIGCEIIVNFDPTGKGEQIYNSVLTVTTGNPIPLTRSLSAEKKPLGISPNFIFKIANEVVDNHDLGTITVPEKKTVSIIVENIGNGSGNPNLTILPNNIFSITKNNCPSSLGAGLSCSLSIAANTYGRTSNSYSSRIFTQNNSMILKAYVFSPNNCASGTHLDPITLNCAQNIQTENISNGTRTRNWVFDPPPGQWGEWSYTCSQPFYEVSPNNDGCIFKRRMLTLSTVGGGTISGGSSQLYDFNQIVTLTAIPSQYYFFKEWSGDGCSGSVPTCSVTMNQARNIQAIFDVYPVNLAPTNSEIYVGQTMNYSATGGLPPYSFVIKNNTGNDKGSIVGNTGLYTAPAQATTATIEVIDSLGNKDNKNITVYNNLLVTQMSPHLYAGSSQMIIVTGGKTPYTYTILSGSGTVVAGLFTAGLNDETVTIRVSDSLNQSQVISYRVVVPLLLSPNANQTILANSNIQFTTTGGLEPYIYSVSGTGSISSGGLFTAPATVGDSIVTVTDSLGNVRNTNVKTILPITVTQDSFVSKQDKQTQINPSGGVPPYFYSIVSGAGSIDSNGLYTSPSNPGNDVIRITDSSGIGLQKDIAVEIIYGVQFIAPVQYVNILSTAQFNSTGGLPPYTYSTIISSGNVNSVTGLFTAGNLPAQGTIRVTDSLGDYEEISLRVLDVLDLIIPKQNTVVGKSQIVTGSGGLPFTEVQHPYLYKYRIVSGGGTVSPEGQFIAPLIESVTEIEVEDALGNKVVKEITTYSELFANGNGFEIEIGDELQITGSGGLPPYEYSILSGDSVISSTGLLTGQVLGNVVVLVKDSIGQEFEVIGDVGVVTYSPDYSNFGLCSVSLPCEGTGNQTRSLTSCYKFFNGQARVGAVITDCSDYDVPSNLNQTCYSPAGNKNVSIPNGTKVVQCAQGSTTEVFQSISCNTGYFANGEQCLPDVITYSPTYSSYGSCSINQSVPCSGTGTQSRTISSCQRLRNGNPDGSVSNSFCSSFETPANLSQSCQSDAGQITVSISNGTQSVYCSQGSTVQTPVPNSIVCNAEFHLQSNSCIADVITYSPTYSSYGSCSINQSVPCSGTGEQSRSLTTCQRLRNGNPDGSVANSFCSSFETPENLSQPCMSVAGPLSIAIDNGVRNVYCELGSSSQDLVNVICDLGYGQNGLICESIKEPCLLQDVIDNGWNITHYLTVSGEKIANDITECRIGTCTSLYMSNRDTKSCELRPKAIFVATTSAVGQELWISDGTDAGTNLLKDIRTGSTGSSAQYLTENNGLVYFSARDTATGIEPWITNGTTAGTIMLKNIETGSLHSSPMYFTPFGNKMMFSASDSIAGNELWISDGTDAGTVRVKDIAVGKDPSEPKYLTLCNNKMFFAAGTRLLTGVQSANDELWVSDGTEAGTYMVKDIMVGLESSYPEQLKCVNGVLFFSATDGIVGRELWKSDGTEAGTVRVKDLYLGSTSSQINSSISYQNKYIFAARDDISSHKLWMSDGTDSGTVLLKRIQTTNVATDIQNFFIFKGKLYFTANNQSLNYELWVSDGTTNGTEMFIDLNLMGSSKPSNFVVVDDHFYFNADDGINGRELWVSDGTTIGTYLLADINTTGSSDPQNIVRVGDRIYFSADDGINGRELWVSDGTTIGTYMVKNIHSTGSSLPMSIVPFRP